MFDTIFALSSGVGRAGVAVVRVSGPAAGIVARTMSGKSPIPRRAILTELRNKVTGEVVDHGLLLWFPGPTSFTGEDIVEFHIHGGRAVVGALLDSLGEFEGLRAAGPGEFTRRAFQNRKLDLTSVEGLADLVAADTELQRRQALKQLSGDLPRIAQSWRQLLISSEALIEAHLDFPDENEIPVDITQEIEIDLAELNQYFRDALAARRETEIVRDGGIVLIAGAPNSGKSTLINRIASRDVAIISEIPGTTRDLLEVTIDLRGLPVTFVDSAGIREASDAIEKLGIARTREKVKEAHIVLWLAAVDEPTSEPHLSHPNLWLVNSKSDLISFESADSVISALTGEGVAELLAKIYDNLVATRATGEPSLLVSRRQFSSVSGASEALSRGIARLKAGQLELVAEELRTASAHLDELIGVISNDELLDEVFSRFCLGK
ncbi:MAG: tRNA uridine-5-carboxymethylaminomethyl(34) synthesis GTPase MnmE [Beijerinckiaceae bacterium]|nr:tRNA uridine-5-carboxymethylaminomethyl(34) synthesis GTPase MnmE [Beijerinckiaceae bacterium]